jgi:MFS family permease
VKRGSAQFSPVLTIAIAQLFGTSLWFSANSAADDLVRTWGLTAANIGTLTAAVQAGFILGTMAFALLGLADRFSASRIFGLAALLGAGFNAWFACLSGDFSAAIALRFAVGVCLAGIYPIGMKLIISWAPDRAGAALALLVGMLTLGTALPHGLRIAAAQWPWQYVMAGSSVLACAAAVLVLCLGNGRICRCAGMVRQVPAIRCAPFAIAGSERWRWATSGICGSSTRSGRYCRCLSPARRCRPFSVDSVFPRWHSRSSASAPLAVLRVAC